MRWEELSSQELEAVRAIERRLVEGCSIGIQPPGADALEVPLQREYKGNNPALPSLLADAPCSRFSAEQLLLILNSLLYTAYPLVNPLSDLLQHYISQTEIDFGTLYSRLRLVWTKQDFDNYEEKRLQTEEEMRACRQSLSQGGVIIQPKVPPRRMWDLYSNRVIGASLIYAISHSWMAVDQRHDILTPVNHFEWRVPFPCDSSLERVRVELLNMGAEYAWLDVLCLRQFDQEVPGEALRQEEWKMDVPTIGRVYEETHHVVHYFSGLGRPFAIGDLTSDRHWLNRAWTLQEVGLGGFRVTAGLTDDSPQDPWEIEDKISGSGPFYDRLAAMDDIDGDSPQALLNALLSMRIRDCSSPLDRVAGLAYPLGVRRLPTYDYKNWDPEKAWNELLLVMEPKAIMMLSMASAFQGSGNYKFLPSWRQIMESNDWHRITNPICARVLRQLGNMHQQDGRFYARVSLILDCHLTGLGNGPADGTLKGKVSMKTHSGELIERACNAVTSIPDGVYHLLAFVDLDDVGRTGWKSSAVETFNWIVGYGRNAAQFEKVGVVELCDLYCPLDWEEVVRDTVVEML
ncbi:hypothetical protein BKA70DRAFT_1178971 [Coprinopsis sp. MPI-PUGE-AT-0042]|nr:hypothetical protein BKA70DRAFT_1178971 [Coprinopsis sp. MPI-PUGE-AT-0042]